MRQSQYFLKTSKTTPADDVSVNAKLDEVVDDALEERHSSLCVSTPRAGQKGESAVFFFFFSFLAHFRLYRFLPHPPPPSRTPPFPPPPLKMADVGTCGCGERRTAVEGAGASAPPVFGRSAKTACCPPPRSPPDACPDPASSTPLVRGGPHVVAGGGRMAARRRRGGGGRAQ